MIRPSPQARRWTFACRVADIVPNTGGCVRLGAWQVAVFRLRDPHSGAEQFHAIDNVDPFSGAAVLARGLLGSADGRAYVASPMYKQRFALDDGSCLDDPDVAVAAFPVRVVDGWLLVGTPDATT